jgi:hypothetical protein
MVVRWRENGTQRARRFKTEAEALAFDEGVSGRVAKPRSASSFPGWLRARRPYLTAGTPADYEVHGRKRLLPHFGERRLTTITTSPSKTLPARPGTTVQ